MRLGLRMLRRLVRSALRSLGARYPFHRTARIVHNPLTRWATAPLRQPEPVRCPNGLVVYVVPSDLIGRQLYLTGTWDPHLLLVLEALARGSEVIVDVGANVGFFALSMAAAAPTAAVHAVEPHPLLADLIERSVRASALPRVTIHRFALSESSGQATLAVDAHHLGIVEDRRGNRSRRGHDPDLAPARGRVSGRHRRARDRPDEARCRGPRGPGSPGHGSLAVHAQSARHPFRSSRPRRRSSCGGSPPAPRVPSHWASTRD